MTFSFYPISTSPRVEERSFHDPAPQRTTAIAVSLVVVFLVGIALIIHGLM